MVKERLLPVIGHMAGLTGLCPELLLMDILVAVSAELIIKRLIAALLMAFPALHLKVLAVKPVAFIIRGVMVKRCRLPRLCTVA